MVVPTLDSSSTLLFFLQGIVNCDCERPTSKIEAKKSSAKTLLTPKLLLEQELTRIRKCLPILKPPSPVSVSRTLLTGAALSGSPPKIPHRASLSKAGLETPALYNNSHRCSCSRWSGRSHNSLREGAALETDWRISAHRAQAAPLTCALPCCCCWSKSGSPVQTTDPRK